LDFVKLVQGLANAELAGERFLIIGADPRQRKFFSVENITEFDEASVSSVLSKYLEPLPNFQIFNNLSSNDGHAFIILVLAAIQPRPIVIKTEGHRADGKTRLQVGEVWIKDHTSLRPANRSDMDRMYRQRIEEEAEDRARKRFRYMHELSIESTNGQRPPHRLPSREMLVEPEGAFRRYVEELISEDDSSRLRMLLEVLREVTVDEWDTLEMRNSKTSATLTEQVEQIDDFFRSWFLPSLQSLTSLGLLAIKYDCPVEWLASVADILMESFDAVRRLQPLKSQHVITGGDSLDWWRPGFEIFLAFRCIAIYSTHRWKLHYLKTLVPRFAVRMEIDDRSEFSTPMLLWPLPGDLFNWGVLNDGRATFYWNERIATSWGKYFGNQEKFTNASCQLEFIIELNSFLGTNHLHDASLQKWLEENLRGRSFTYNPDLFAYSLASTVPIAERCYDLIASNDVFPHELAFDPALFNSAFKGKTSEQRLLIFGRYLAYLREFQSRFSTPPHFRFSFGFTWQGRLADAVARYKETTYQKKS
jgi:hypothetical protein